MFNTYNATEKTLQKNTECPYFCEKYFEDTNKKCRKFYERLVISKEKGIFQCPYGFSCIKTEKAIYSTLIVNGQSDLTKIKRHLEDYKEKSNDYTYYSESQIKKIIQEAEKRNSIHETFSQTVHDIKNANQSMIDLVEEVENDEKLQDLLDINTDLHSLAEGYRLIQYRLEYHDWALNESLPYSNRICQISIYKMIEKLSFQLKYRAKKKNISMKITGPSYNSFKQQVSLYLAFFLLLENAIKYAPERSAVNVCIIDKSGDSVQVTISNYCGIIEKEEISRLKEYGFRAKSVIGNATGKGLGMSLADKIINKGGSKLEIEYKDIDEEKGHFSAIAYIKPLL